MAECFQDYRQVNRIDDSIESLIAQRIYGLIMGYEDLNDHEELRNDPMQDTAMLHFIKQNSGVRSQNSAMFFVRLADE